MKKLRSGHIKKGNYIRVDTEFIFTTIKVNLDVNYRQFKEDFVFALMKCSSAALGEQNKIDNDSKCQLVYKSSNTSFCCGLPMRLAHSSNPTKYIHELSIIVDYNYHELSLKLGKINTLY